MKKLTPKKSGFTKKSLFVREDFTYEIGESESLPENTVFGFELPEEEGNYFARTQLGAMYIKILGDGIEILPWSTHTGILGDYTYTGGAVIPQKPVHEMFLLTDGESDGAYVGGEYSFNYGLVGTFDDGNGDYSKSFTEVGESLVVPQQPMSINKDTGDINWMYIDSENRPAFPWGLRNNRSVVNERYFIFLNRDTTIIVLNTATGEVIEEVPMSVISNVDYVEEGNLFQLPNTNEFLYMGDDYVNEVGRAFILSVDENAAPGSRITVIEHPESGVLHEGKQLFWGWYEFGSYWYWGIWNLCYLLDPEEGSYYLFYLSDFNTKTGSLAKFNSSHTLEWVYNLYDIPVFSNEYIFYTFAKANGRIALLPSYSENVDVNAPIVVLDDSDGTPIVVPSTESEKLSAYVSASGNQYPVFLYAKAPSGSRIPFIASVETYDEITFEEEFVFIYGYFDVDTLTWVENTATNVPEGTFYTWFAYPLDSRTACLQKQADGSYFYFLEMYTGEQFSSVFDSQYLVRLNSDFSGVSFERMDYGGLNNPQTVTSIQSTVSSEGRFFGITGENIIFSSVLDNRPRINLAQDVILEKDRWYDFKSSEWNTGIRPIPELFVNYRGILSTSAYPFSAKYIPLDYRNILDLNTGRIKTFQSTTTSTTIAPDQQTIIGTNLSSGSGPLSLNSLTGEIENPNSYPLYGIAAKYVFRQDGSPVVVTATATQATVRRHNGTSWVADTAINLDSASSQRYFLHNDLLYAFRAVDGGNAVISVYNWDTPGWSTHNSIPTPAGTTVYYDATASFNSVSLAYGNGIIYLSNGFEYNMETGLMTEVPYAETFYSAYRISGGLSNSLWVNRVTLQVVGDYLYVFYARPGVGYLGIRPLLDGLPPPF